MSKPVLAKGVDISYSQGNVDFAKLKNSVDFVIIRCGFGGDYKDQDDKMWARNVAGCEKYGIPYGVYLYSYATTTEKAKSEAAHALRLLNGRNPDYPVFLDLEEARIANTGRANVLRIAKTFCAEIEKAGYTYGTYANKSWFSDILTDKWYDSKIKWLAQYNSSVTYRGSYDIWQYSSTGRVNGVNGNVDMNFCYLSFLKGDVDNDGKVTPKDARIILRVAANLESLNGQSEINADVNGDGKINAEDAREVLRESAGLD